MKTIQNQISSQNTFSNTNCDNEQCSGTCATTSDNRTLQQSGGNPSASLCPISARDRDLAVAQWADNYAFDVGNSPPHVSFVLSPNLRSHSVSDYGALRTEPEGPLELSTASTSSGSSQESCTPSTSQSGSSKPSLNELVPSKQAEADASEKKTKIKTLSPSSSGYDSDSDESESDKSEDSISLTGKNKLIIVLLCIGNFALGCSYAVLAPFFPKEAESKGVSPVLYSFVFSIFEFGIFFCSPIFGKVIPHFELRFLLSTGLLVAGWCEILFGLLYWSPPGVPFIALAFTLRLTESIGVAAFYTSCWTLIGIEFPHHISKLFATTEMCYGLGMIAGPALGGFLYELGENLGIGGFFLPFLTIGLCTLFISISIRCFLPQNDDPPKITRTSIWQVIKKWNVSLNILISMYCVFLVGFNDATLEPHIREFTDLKPSMVGAVFMLPGVVYAAFNQIWGHLCEKASNALPLCICGCLLCLASFTFMGPLPIFNAEPQLWMIIVGQFCLGAGMGGMLVGSFVQGLRETINNGFPDSISTYACISGIFSSAFSLGCALGPLVGGFLVEDIGYRNTTLILVIFQGILIMLIIGYLMCCRAKTQEEIEEDDAMQKIKDAESSLLLPKGGKSHTMLDFRQTVRRIDTRCPLRREYDARRIRSGSTYLRRNPIDLVAPRSRHRRSRPNVRELGFHPIYERQRSHSYCSGSLVQSL